MTKKLFDRLIYSIVTRQLDGAAVAGYAEAVERQEHFASAPAFQTVDAKATGLLTHVSMMIAGLGLVAPLVSNSDVELGMIIAEMAVYLVIAVGCLRCLSLFAGHDLSGADLEARVTRELLIRRELLALCNRASIIMTIVVFVLLPIQFLWHPEK
jgi:hypothetical protein